MPGLITDLRRAVSPPEAAAGSPTDGAARRASVVTLTIAVGVSVAWRIGSPPLAERLPALLWMRPSTAACFAVAAVSLGLLSAERPGARWRTRLARITAALVALVGLAWLVGQLGGIDPGLDRWIAPRVPRGAMAPLTAASFVLLGAALLLASVEARGRRASRWLAGAAAFNGLVGLLGNLYHVTEVSILYWDDVTRVEPHTAILLVLLGVGTFLLGPEGGVVSVLRSERAGGVLGRQLLPAVVAVPVVLGWLRMIGEQQRLYASESGAALFTVLTISLLAAITWSSARRIDELDRERAEALRASARSEARYRQVTNAAFDAIIVADHAGVITLCNSAVERVFGYSASELVGRPLTVLVPPALREAHLRGLRRFVETRVSRVAGRVIDLRGLRKSGEEFPLEMSLTAAEVGGELQFTGVIRDQTERERTRTLLAQNEKLASIGLLSAGIAHEINNPMAFVTNNLHVLRRDTMGLFDALDASASDRDAARADLARLREALDRTFERTYGGATRVTRIVQSLRSLARTDAPQMTPVDLQEVLGDDVDLVRGSLARSGATIEVRCDDALTIECIPTLLSQAVLNLLNNAVLSVEAAHPQGGGRVRVACRRQGDAVTIEVADNGVGIPPENLPKLFDPFFTTRPVGEGTGLGLSITHSIVAAHEGRIEVESRPGEGATFCILLPAAQRRAADRD